MSIGRPVTRRDFVATSIVGAASAYSLANPLTGSAVPLPARGGPRTAAAQCRTMIANDADFAAGVASGQVAEREVTLWTQAFAFDPSQEQPPWPTSGPPSLYVEVATDDCFNTVVRNGWAPIDLASGTARIRVTDQLPDPTTAFPGQVWQRLERGQRYFYRFADGTKSSGVGRFRTALPPGSKEKVKIAFITCQDFVSGYYVAHKDLVSQDVDLIVSLGDYIYETAFFAGGVRAVPETPDGSLRTLPEYRSQYQTYHTDENLRAVRAMAPMHVIWDDHEVQDNYASTHPGHEWKEGGRTNISFMERRAAAYQAFFENHPLMRNADEADRTYDAYRIGCVDLVQLDLRQYKTDQPCNPEDGPFAFCPDPSVPLSPDNTILGGAQRDWMLNRLKTSKAEWKLIANQVMMMSNDILPGYTFDTEGWDGYANDRRILCDWLTENKIKNTHVITGDVHMFYAGHVTRTGRDASVPFGGLTPGGPVMSEFVIGAMTSQGISDRISGTLAEIGYQIQQALNPGSPRYTDEPFRNGVAKVVDDFLSGMNPHWKYANSSYKGYGIVECTPSKKPRRGTKIPGKMTVKFRATHDVKLADSAPFTLASFTIEADKPQLHVDATAAQRRSPLPIDKNVPINQSNVRDYILQNAAH